MLVLSRKEGQEIVIGENIRVTVVAIRGNQVRLGFEASRDVAIRRDELAPQTREMQSRLAVPAKG